jgi:hypothetical protein
VRIPIGATGEPLRIAPIAATMGGAGCAAFPTEGATTSPISIEEGAAMDARTTGGLAEGIRERGGWAEADDSTGVDLLDRAEEAVAHARRVRADAAAMLAEFERLRRRIRIGHRPVP